MLRSGLEMAELAKKVYLRRITELDSQKRHSDDNADDIPPQVGD